MNGNQNSLLESSTKQVLMVIHRANSFAPAAAKKRSPIHEAKLQIDFYHRKGLAKLSAKSFFRTFISL